MILVIIFLAVVISVCIYFKYTNYFKKKENNELVNFLNTVDEGTLIIELTKEQFEKIEILENKNIYYFPSDCSNYKEEQIIQTGPEGLEKFFVPEKNKLIIVKDTHKWVKEPKDFQIWKK